MKKKKRKNNSRCKHFINTNYLWAFKKQRRDKGNSAQQNLFLKVSIC